MIVRHIGNTYQKYAFTYQLRWTPCVISIKRTPIKLLRRRRTKIAGNMTAGSKALWRHCWNIAGNVIKTRRYWCAQTIGRFTFKGVIPPSKEGNPPLKWRVKFVASLFLTATAGLSIAFFQSCSISIEATLNCLSIDTNIDMYVPFCKTIHVDDVTFRFSLHHHFWPGLKKTVEHNLGTCICSNVETILSWSCHVYGPFDFRTSLGRQKQMVVKFDVQRASHAAHN